MPEELKRAFGFENYCLILPYLIQYIIYQPLVP